MGTTFCNINIRGAGPEAVAALCPNGIVRQISADWVTVVDPAQPLGKSAREGRRLSKTLPFPVLVTEYFDDDAVVLSLYREGRQCAGHVLTDQVRRRGKAGDWAEQLGLSPEQEKILYMIFKETSPQVCLQLLEGLFGCVLWVVPENIGQVRWAGTDYLTGYLNRKRAEKRLKNQTRLKLLEELPGERPGCFDDCHIGHYCQTGQYPFVQRHEDGRRTFWDIQEGKLRRLFTGSLGGVLLDSYAHDRGKGVFLVTVGRGSQLEQAQVFSDDGQLLLEVEGRGLREGGFLPGGRVFIREDCWELRAGQKAWTLGLEEAWYPVASPCVLAGGRLAVAYDTKRPNRPDGLLGWLMSFDADGGDRVTRQLRDYFHWQRPLAVGDTLYMASQDWGDHNSVLTAYNGRLEEQWSLPLACRIPQFTNPGFDPTTNVLYLYNYDSVVAVDLENRQVIAQRKLYSDEACYLEGVLPGVGPVMRCGNSTIQVWNRQLETISRHRMKGWLRTLVQEGTALYAVSADEDTLRLYQLQKP